MIQKSKIVLLLVCLAIPQAFASDDIEAEISSSFNIEGKIAPPEPKPKDWYWSTKIYLDGGKRIEERHNQTQERIKSH